MCFGNLFNDNNNSCLWIVIILILISCCGNNSCGYSDSSYSRRSCGCDCNNNCGCC